MAGLNPGDLRFEDAGHGYDVFGFHPQTFVRVHRSVIVNIDCVKEVLSPPHQDRTVIMKDGTALPVGRAYSDRLLR